MKYAIVQVSNGNYSIVAEGIKTEDAAKVQYHGICQSLWNASDVETACVMIVDENLDAVNGYKEQIIRNAAPQNSNQNSGQASGD